MCDLDQVGWLASCGSLSALTLEGNPVSVEKGYRRRVLEAIPSLETLDDFDRADAICDDDSEEESEEEKGGGGEAFAANVSVDDEDADPANLSVVAPLKEWGSKGAKAELMVVHQGIKHARTGFDDVDFGLDQAPEMAGRPGTGGNRPGSARVGTASFRPGSAVLSSRGPMSPGGSVSLNQTGGPVSSSEEDGRGSRRGSGGGGRGSSTSMSMVSSSSWGSRPMSAMVVKRPGSAMGGRPVTASSGGRPGTAWAGAAWAARRSARDGSRGGEGTSEVEVASELTFDTEEVYCGNLTRGLRKRNVTRAAERYEEGAARASVEMTTEEVIEELRRWKIEVASLAMTPDEELPELPPLKVGDIIGGGAEADRLNLDASGSDQESGSDESDGDESSDAESQAPTARSVEPRLSAAAPSLSLSSWSLSATAVPQPRAQSLYQKPIGSAGGARVPGSPTGSTGSGGVRRTPPDVEGVGASRGGIRVPLGGVQHLSSSGGGQVGMAPHPPPRGGEAGLGGTPGRPRGVIFRAPMLVPEAT